MATCACVLLVLLPFDWRSAAHTMRGRAATFQKMRAMRLNMFAGQTVIAGDVGFIGYFTQGNVCDLDGLVNGRGGNEMHMTAGR